MTDKAKCSIYVASSWRNEFHAGTVHMLRNLGHEVYDFKNPPHNTGFGWEEVGMRSYMSSENNEVPIEEYILGLRHERAIEGFNSDFNAMMCADECVLVLPCGRSAHLEAGWFIGAHRPVNIVLPEANVVPELMYKMATNIFPGFASLASHYS